MDNMILALIPEGKTILGLVNTFCVNEGYSFEDAQQAIETWGEERGVKIRIGTWRGRLDTVFSSNQKIKNLIDTIAFIICISICMLCITVQLLNIYMKRNELGIWLANGMTRMDVLEILWMENFIKVAIGGIIAVVIEKLLLQLLFSDSKSTFREIVSMMYGNPLLGLVLFAILLVCIISAIPIGIIARKSTTELVKGVWN
jgi:ABC-type lipoprotein release transport system permease subunit